METTYPEPVSRLLTYGDCDEPGDWPNYLDRGFTPEHVPDLIRLATNEELLCADSDGPEVWAPIHAWRALGQLRAEAAIQPLMRLFAESGENDWVMDEMPDVYGMIGAAAISPLADYLSAPSHSQEARITAAQCLERIGSLHSEAREECVAVLTRELQRYSSNSPTLSGFLVSFLIDLKAVDSIGVIREAYAKKRVDLSIAGDIEDVEVALGLRTERATPARRTILFGPTSADPGITVRPAAPRPKIGRNDPCPCGSGKKYKKCCLGK